MKVVITDDVIRAARTRDSQHCMIAEAISAANPQAKRISVDLATVRFTDPKRGLRYTYLTPRIAQVELVKFDQGRPSQPFDFTLKAGHVTSAGSHRTKGPIKDRARQAAGKKGAEKKLLRRQSTRATGTGGVAQRVGGKTPPLQKSGTGDVPFSRRRAFGLRALDY